MIINEKVLEDFQHLEEAKVITKADTNLRSKIDSIVRSLENLSAKRLRIEFEIKKQQKSLIRKRAELKKVSHSQTLKVKAALETGNLTSSDPEGSSFLRRIDSKIFHDIDRVLGN